MVDAEDGPATPPGTIGRFYAGVIKKLFVGAGMGVVRSATGREVSFAAAHVILVGPVRKFEDLREGMVVGFDVGWTSKGLRVTVLRAQPPGAPPV